MFRWAWIRVLVINTHMDQAVSGGIIAWALKNFMGRPNIIMFQEVSKVAQLMRMLPPGYTLLFDSSSTSGTNYIAIKDSRFKQPAVTFDADARHGSRHGRSTRGALLWDKKLRMWLCVSVLHPDPLGRGFEHADPRARATHTKQVEDTVGFHRTFSNRARVHISAGDVNEQMRPQTWMSLPAELYKQSAPVLFRKQNMIQSARLAQKSEGPIRLMEAFITQDDNMKVKRSRRTDTPVKGMDHELLGVWIKVRKAR